VNGESNADLIVRLLRAAGVRWVFGIPSGPVLPLIEALRKSDVEFVLTASETSAGFMASVVGQLTGVPGVCVATLGPGATNLTTGVGAAWLDRAPVLAITCNVATPWLDRRVQMRIDHHALFEPLTKASLPLRQENVEDVVATALALAALEPPGPVHLDLPEDVASAQPAVRPHSNLLLEGAEASLGGETLDSAEEAVNLIEAALQHTRRPLVVTGLSLTRSGSVENLRQFLETQHIPFISTLHAKGWLPESYSLWAGVLGRARRTDVQALINRADCVLAVGFDPVEINYEEWVRDRPLLHLSTETAEDAGSVRFALNAAVDLDIALARLARLPRMSNDWTRQDLDDHRTNLEGALRPGGSGFGLHHLLDLLRDRLPPDAILAYDVGAHTHQIATQWRTDFPGTCLATNGWSSMGFGMPAAYAAKLVHPERLVVGVVGDGGFEMTAGELALARRQRLAVPTIVLNDGWLGLMKVKQERKGLPLSGVYLGEPPPSPEHYFGVPVRAARSPTGFLEALDWALGLDGPSVIEAFIDVESYSTTVFD
jgi:acetolactate synthase-1/2/3 large subunit